MEKRQIHYSVYLLGLMVIALVQPFSLKATNITAAIVMLNWLIEGNFKLKLNQLKARKYFWLFMAVYLVYVLGLLQTQDFRTGLNVLEIKLGLLLIPLVISNIKLRSGDLDKVLMAFVVGVVISSIYALYEFGFSIGSFEALLNSVKTHGLRDNYYVFTGIHPTYLSFYAGVSIFFIIFLLNKHLKIAPFALKLLALLVLLYLITLLFLLSARMPQIGFALTIITISGLHFIRQRKYKAILSVAFAIVALAGLFFTSPTLSKRFQEIATTPLEPPRGIHYNSTNIRVGIFNCASEYLNQSWLIGFGTGNLQASLNQCYQSKNYSDVLYLENYGVHNAYLDIWITTGILGLIILILALCLPLYKALATQNYLYAAYILFFAMCCLTESMLNTNKGVMVYAFFNSLFALSFYSASENLEKRKGCQSSIKF